MLFLDTNVISELFRHSPDPAVRAYLHVPIPESIFTSAVCVAEIRYGLGKMPPGRRRDVLSEDVEMFLADVLADRIVAFDDACARLYGEIKASREARGMPIGMADAMIAATARLNGATLLTRNTKDFEHCGIELVDPWLQPPSL